MFLGVIMMFVSIPLPDATLYLQADRLRVITPGTGLDGTNLVLMMLPLFALVFPIVALATRIGRLTAGAAVPGAISLLIDVLYLLTVDKGFDWQIGSGTILMTISGVIVLVGALLALAKPKAVVPGGYGGPQGPPYPYRPPQR